MEVCGGRLGGGVWREVRWRCGRWLGGGVQTEIRWRCVDGCWVEVCGSGVR